MNEYKVKYTERAIRKLNKLDKYTRLMIFSWIDKNLVGCENLHSHGKALNANRKGQWRYQIGDCRLICHIQDDELIILTLSVGHRHDVYHN